MSSFNFIDTDLFIHRVDYDPPVVSAAQSVLDNNHPLAISEFTLLELKGNYVQDLILLHHKVSDSDNLERAFAKVRRSGGRRSELMLAMLIRWIGNFSPHPWKEARRELLTYLDSQITIFGEGVINIIDKIFQGFDCTRAQEPPIEENGKWNASIPLCRDDNTKCKINEFLNLYLPELKNLVLYLNSVNPSNLTDELRTIKNHAENVINSKFIWRGQTCRKIGDLLIGLQSKSGQKLISSNRKEHIHLSGPLGYIFEEFPIVSIRTK